MSNLADQYREFWDDLLRDAEVSGEPQQACFFELYARTAAENGDCTDLTYTPVRKEGTQGYQIDGYALDTDRGELHLAVCDFRPDGDLEALNQTQIASLFRRAERFFRAALRPEFINALEEVSPAFEAAYPIHAHQNLIRRVRIIVFSNARLATRKRSVESQEIFGKTFTYNLLDFPRYISIMGSRNGSEPIEIDIADLNAKPLPCLQAHTGDDAYQSYLVVMPGQLLAKIYGLYGARLLEQNVRTFLQARTKVNQGIIQTLLNAPTMFFAYNNGLTATASRISTQKLEDGSLGIASIENLQIVNGGQTTASILYAHDRNKADLSQVSVQMKLSVVDSDRIEEVVPKISRFANTQNRISEADFFSNHPFHVAMEKISRRLPAPQKAGAFSSTKWFYERARGQYKDQKAYGTTAARRKFEVEFPADQVFVKTDAAKYELTFACMPHVVSQGAQKCFLAFAETVSKSWEQNPDAFNELYYKDLIAKAIIFTWVDQMIAASDWYMEDRGYKANIVTYTIAWLVNHLKQNGFLLDFQQVWNRQEPDDSLKRGLEHCAPIVARAVKDTPADIKNVSEYAKRQACWAAVSRLQISLPGDLSGCASDRTESSRLRKDALEVKKIDNGIELDALLIRIAPLAGRIKEEAQTRRLLSPSSDSGLRKLAAGNLKLSQSEKKAVGHLLTRLQENGASLPA